MFKKIKIAFVAFLAFSVLSLSGCATWSNGSIDQTSQQRNLSLTPTDPSHITLLVNDITNRQYTSLGDISVTVNKTTVFNAAPTQAQVDEALKEKAASLGADAVILVRYGNSGVSAFSWGSLEGKGRAIKFKH